MTPTGNMAIWQLGNQATGEVGGVGVGAARVSSDRDAPPGNLPGKEATR